MRTTKWACKKQTICNKTGDNGTLTQQCEKQECTNFPQL